MHCQTFGLSKVCAQVSTKTPKLVQFCLYQKISESKVTLKLKIKVTFFSAFLSRHSGAVMSAVPDMSGFVFHLWYFFQSTLDLRQPHSVLAACIYLSKAFNRVDHTLVIQDLYDMHTPPWLLRIVISYLSNRSMYLTYNGAKSSRKCYQEVDRRGRIWAD